MCVIAVKAAGIEMPTTETIENMWLRNPDGAGFMYARDGKVHIEKGFMKLESLKAKLKEVDDKYNMKKLPVIMHFRITTHGGTSPENTHPFPISDSIGMLKKRRLTTDLGVAHNGIISVTPRKDISDTMEYIAGQLAPLKRAVPDFYKNKDLLQMIEHATDSKLAFLDRRGKIVTVGDFVEDAGIKYSNNSYKGYTSWRDFKWDEWEDYNCGYDYSGGWKAHRVADMVMRKLMWLDDSKGEYVKNEFTNCMMEGEYALDSAGCLYEYDYNLDCFEEVYAANFQAYNSEGFPLKYNSKSNMISEELVML